MCRRAVVGGTPLAMHALLTDVALPVAWLQKRSRRMCHAASFKAHFGRWNCRLRSKRTMVLTNSAWVVAGCADAKEAWGRSARDAF